MGKGFPWPSCLSTKSRWLTTGPLAQDDLYASPGLLGSLCKILQTGPVLSQSSLGANGGSP